MVTKPFDQLVTETINKYLEEELICEYAMDQGKMMDKYSEVVDAITDNFVCISLYPHSQTIQHWKSRIPALLKRFIDIEIKPRNKNTFENRLKVFNNAVIEVLNEDYSALINHFETVSKFYANKENPHDRLKPYKPYEEVCKESASMIIDGILSVTRFVAARDLNGLIEFMRNY